MNDIEKPPFFNHYGSGFVFGCEQLGGYEWGDVNIKSLELAIEYAVENGVKVFDTADCYGKGLSETRLGTILAGRRDQVTIATKFGVRFSNTGQVFYDNSSEWMSLALEASLKRLRTDYIDFFQMHYWDGRTNLNEVVNQLEWFVKEGKIRAYGFTNVADLPTELVGNSRFQTMSLEYSLANRSNESIAREFSERGFSFLSYGSLGQGILSGKYGRLSKFSSKDRRSRVEYKNFHGEKFEANLRIVDTINQWSELLNISVPLIALKWIRQSIPNSVPLVGIKNIEQVKGVLDLDDSKLPDEALAELSAISGSLTT